MSLDYEDYDEDDEFDFDLKIDPYSLIGTPHHILVERAKANAVRQLKRSRRKCEKSLPEFIRQAWHIVEPAQPYVDNWHIDFISHHLQAVTNGEINRLLINVPPGMMKSLLVNVFWPAWEWTKHPGYRYVCTAHSQNLAVRDSTKMRRLVQSNWYQQRWGDKVKLTGDVNAKTKFENTNTGFREAVAFESMTGVRGDRVTIDDPHSVDSAMSDIQRQTTIDTFLEAVPTRLTNPATSAIVVIMQRLHESDVSGVILEKQLGYTHIMLPMEFDPDRKCITDLGYEDLRDEPGELLFPQRFPREVVERDKQVMGPYAVAGQFQQTPSPRGGGIIKREWWQLWDDEMAQANGLSGANKYPPMDYIIASLDPAYTEKKENDPSALTVWGVWQRGGQSARRILSRTGEVSDIIDDRDTIPSLMLMHGWEKRLPIHGPDVLREEGESENAFKIRQQLAFGLVEHVIETCNKYNVDMLLVEAKASGLSVAQEIKRLNKTNTWGVELVNPGNADKVARTYAVQATFSNGVVYAPDKDWAEKVITQCEQFPKAKHDDLVDSMTQALKYLRERNLIRRPEEIIADIKFEGTYRPQTKAVYDV
jgi:predicted phage terminase large subunit-like protein